MSGRREGIWLLKRRSRVGIGPDGQQPPQGGAPTGGWKIGEPGGSQRVGLEHAKPETGGTPQPDRPTNELDPMREVVRVRVRGIARMGSAMGIIQSNTCVLIAATIAVNICMYRNRFFWEPTLLPPQTGGPPVAPKNSVHIGLSTQQRRTSIASACSAASVGECLDFRILFGEEYLRRMVRV